MFFVKRWHYPIAFYSEDRYLLMRFERGIEMLGFVTIPIFFEQEVMGYLYVTMDCVVSLTQ